MANELPEQSQFDETLEAILTTEPVQGDPPAFQGQPTGKINVNLLKLANRCRWLKNALAALNITVPNATTRQRGIAELATKAEAEALKDTIRITPPKRVGDILKHQNAQATESQRGTVQRATQTEVEDGANTTKYVTPATLDEKVDDFVESTAVDSVVKITQAAYDALASKGSKTLYIIVG